MGGAQSNGSSRGEWETLISSYSILTGRLFTS